MTVEELRRAAGDARASACQTAEKIRGLDFPLSDCLVDDIIQAAVLTVKANLLEEHQSDDYGIGRKK